MKKISKTNKWKKTLLIISLLSFLIVSLFLYSKFSFKKNIEVLSDTIEEQVEDVVELSTIKYNYTNILEYEDKKEFNGINLPFTSKSFIIKYSGYLKAGIDLSDLEIDIKNNKNVDIVLKKPKILENVISEEDVLFFNEKESIFNNLEFDDLYKVLIDEKKKMEKEVIEKGILDEAGDKSKEILTSLLKNMDFENISIKFKE